MKTVSKAYKKAMNENLRSQSYMLVTLGIINDKAQSSASVVSETTYFSNNTLLLTNNPITSEYATMEENQTRVDGSQYFVPRNNEPQLLPSIGCVSSELKGTITFSFNNYYDIKGLTIKFGESYPTSFIVSNGTTTITYENESQKFTCTDSFDNSNLISIIPLTFVNGDNKRLRIEKITMGVGVIFQNADISEATIDDSVSFTSEELPQLDLSLTVFNTDGSFDVDNETSFINYLQTGQEITTSIGIELEDGSIEWVKMPKTYLSEWSSDDFNATFASTDRIALLTDKYTAGNTIHTRTLFDDAQAIFDYLGLKSDEYNIDESLKDYTVTNPLPESSCAELLQLIANAGRCTLTQGLDGEIYLKANFENILDPSEITLTAENYTDYSNPQNVNGGEVTVTYADMTKDFTSADGSMFFLPKDTSEYSTKTGFISKAVGSDDGTISEDIPTISLELPAAYTFYGLLIKFGGNPARDLTVEVFDEDKALINTVNVTNNEENDLILTDDFKNFRSIKITFTKASPNDRVLVKQVKFGNIADYRLTKDLMLAVPAGTLEVKKKQIDVKIYTFENDEEGNPQEVEDSVYATEILNTTGEVVTFENQLIGTEAHAKIVAEWLGNYYNNNVTYNVEYRGEPRIQASDYIYMDSDHIDDLQCEIEKHTLKFNGAISGTLDLRRATDMTD